jgi:uncharacterized protein (DUF58 family)
MPSGRLPARVSAEGSVDGFSNCFLKITSNFNLMMTLLPKSKMPLAPTRWIARLSHVLAGRYCMRFERYVNWLRRPLAILVQAMIASSLCGLFLHPQGFLLAFGIGAVLIVGVVWPWLSLVGVTGSLSFEKGRAREGEPVKPVMSIRNRCPWGTWGLAVYAGLEHRSTRGLIDRPDASLRFAAGWTTTDASWDFVPECRGVYPACAPLIASGFPFGLRRARRELAIGRTLLVWPRTFSVGPIPDAAEGRSAEGLAPRDKPGTWGDLLGVRPYRRGDSLRRIHWPQTARYGQLVVCEVQASAVPRVQIVLDTHPGSHAGLSPDGSCEWAIRVAASFAEGWIKQGAQIDIVIEGGSVISGAGPGRARSAIVLDALARLAPTGDHDLARLLSLPECRRCDRGVRVVVTTDVGLRRLPSEILRRAGDRFVVLKAGAFGLDDRIGLTEALPVIPWIWIDGPGRVAPSLARAGREVAFVS